MAPAAEGDLGSAGRRNWQACLAAVRQATLAELAAATDVHISEMRLALRRLAERLELTDLLVLDDGSHVQLAPEKHFHEWS